MSHTQATLICILVNETEKWVLTLLALTLYNCSVNANKGGRAYSKLQLMQILDDPHFCNLVAIIRIPLHSRDWREENPEVRFPERIFRIKTMMTKQHFRSKGDRYEFTQLFINLLKDIMLADSRLRYTKDDIQWFVEAMEQENALVIMSMLFASAYADDQYMTPPEIAAQTGKSESNWRNKAAAGEFPGAIKRGKVWLIPVSVLRSRGIITEYLAPTRDDDTDEPIVESD
jgi:hypothetical protein